MRKRINFRDFVILCLSLIIFGMLVQNYCRSKKLEHRSQDNADADKWLDIRRRGSQHGDVRATPLAPHPGPALELSSPPKAVEDKPAGSDGVGQQPPAVDEAGAGNAPAVLPENPDVVIIGGGGGSKHKRKRRKNRPKLENAGNEAEQKTAENGEKIEMKNSKAENDVHPPEGEEQRDRNQENVAEEQFPRMENVEQDGVRKVGNIDDQQQQEVFRKENFEKPDDRKLSETKKIETLDGQKDKSASLIPDWRKQQNIVEDGNPKAETVLYNTQQKQQQNHQQQKPSEEEENDKNYNDAGAAAAAAAGDDDGDEDNKSDGDGEKTRTSKGPGRFGNKTQESSSSKFAESAQHKQQETVNEDDDNKADKHGKATRLEQEEDEQEQDQENTKYEAAVVGGTNQTGDGDFAVDLNVDKVEEHQEDDQEAEAREESPASNLTETMNLQQQDQFASTAGNYSAVERRQAERKRLLAEACERHRLYNFGWPRITSNMLVTDQFKAMYCMVGKVASSTWKKIFLMAAGRIDRSRVDEFEHKSVGARTLKVLKPMSGRKNPTNERRVASYFKFFFVRHPLDRLVSAFLEKFRLVREYQETIGRRIIRHYRQNASAESLARGHDVTLDEFARFMADHGRTSKNIHWTPQSELCTPCSLKYDFIGHYETLYEDGDYILNRLGVAGHVSFPHWGRNRTAGESYREMIAKVKPEYL